MTGQPTFRMLRCGDSVQVGGQFWIEVTTAAVLPVVMGFQFTQYDAPNLFSETLIHGPFQQFDHTHLFENSGGGTLIRDTISCRLKWPYGGEIGTRLMVAKSLHAMFAYRATELQQLAQSAFEFRKPGDI